MKIHRLILIAMLFITSYPLYSQTVKGKIVDADNQPLPYANVVLLSLPDSAFVTGTVSDEQGVFSLPAHEAGGLLRISSIGYTTAYKPCEVPDLGIIRLESDAQLLGEVVVKANLPVTRMQGDALVTNVQNSVLSKAGSANDVLGKIPGITKQKDGFEVFGKGTPLIYINGRKVRDLSELEQLNSDEIKNVEVIRNPGARYDATVKAVVRIRTAKRQGDGLGFNLRSSYYQSENVDLTDQLNLNYRHNDWDVFASVEYQKQKVEQQSDINQTVVGTDRWNHNDDMRVEDSRQKIRADVGVNRLINEAHSLGIKYTINKDFDFLNTAEDNNLVQVNGTEYDYLNSYRTDRAKYKPGHALSAYYNGKINQTTLDFNADYYQDGYDRNSVVNETSAETENRDVHSLNQVSNKLVAANLTLSFPLFNGSFAVGSEATYTHREDNYLNEEDYVPTSLSKIKEINATAFAEYSKSFPLGSLALGLRYEHVKFNYYEDNKRMDDQSRTFDNLFPHASFDTRIGQVQAQLSYTSKTVRPSYRNLSNNISYVNRYTLQTGNPAIRPTIIHDVTLSGVWRFMQFTMSYIRQKDWIMYWADLQQADGSQIMIRYKNFDEAVPLFSAFLSASPKIGCWSPVWSVGVQKQWLTIESNGTPIRMNQPLYIGTFNNTWELPADFMLGLDVRVRSKGDYQNIYLNHATNNVDVSVRKSFLNDALSVELRGTDLFHKNREYNLLRCGYYTIHQENRFDSRQFVLTLRYKFNSTKSKYRGTGAGQEQRKRM